MENSPKPNLVGSPNMDAQSSVEKIHTNAEPQVLNSL